MSTWLDAYIDLELEPEQALALEAHARGCERCAASILERQRLRSALTSGMSVYSVPRRTARSIERMLPSFRGQSAGMSAPWWAWSSLAACLVLAGALSWNLVSPMRQGVWRDELVRDAVSSHIRSLMGAHLADIAVSDQHTVKPWFAGKLEFSPRVIDFASQGFPLTGGRLDYVAGHPAAAIVYSRHAHVINLFCSSEPSVSDRLPRKTTDRGYQAISWTEPGVRFCAVSDLNAVELMQFVQLVRADGNAGK